jgi:hypothetical protein
MNVYALCILFLVQRDSPDLLPLSMGRSTNGAASDPESLILGNLPPLNLLLQWGENPAPRREGGLPGVFSGDSVTSA